MSNLIPPLVSSSPPPIVGPLDEDDDDEFGDFRAAADSYGCDDFSLPSSPKKSPQKEVERLDINSNNSQKITDTDLSKDGLVLETVEKDFQDRRKSSDDSLTEVNCSYSQSNFDIYDNQIGSDVGSPQKDRSEEVDISSKDDQSPDIDNGFEDFVSEVPDSVFKCDDIQNVEIVQGITTITSKETKDLGQDEPKSSTNDEFSESSYANSHPDQISETNEINEIEFEEDLQFEITEDKCDNSLKEITESSISIKVDDTDPKLSDDEFGDFENHFEDQPVDGAKKESDDEFDDFVNPLPPLVQEEQSDDFGDFESGGFADFETQNIEKPMTKVNVENAVLETEIILKEIFPKSELQVDAFDYFDETKGNLIFEELKDVTESKALIYQWSKSHSQQMFLKALNIDTRNILYGPAWSTSMPRFAANLGLTPLEPVKTEILTPTPVQNTSSPSISSQKTMCNDIPTAQFDWSGSGLINPLDSTSTEPPRSTSDEPSPQTTKTDFLPTLSETPDLSVFVTENQEKPEVHNRIETAKTTVDDFSSFHSPKMFPLRETHISNDISDFKPGWLEPTIVTPDLPRKEPIIDPDLEDDEFDDFQMVLPEETTKVEQNITALPDLTEFVSLPKTEIVNKEQHIVELNRRVLNPTPLEDDEFTEFHSSVPKPVILKPMEPLKPSIQYSAPSSTQINWPEPGVTDDDIRNIELTYSRKAEPKTPSPKEVKIKSKESSVDDDEWSDFVSVTNAKTGMPERTATPDLPLSVLNLNHVQAPKQPIPVITPTGLMQTKLSSNLMLQPQVVQKTVQPLKPQTVPFQPSIISNQFAANFPETGDDDDWSDFVSSQPPPQMNGFQQRIMQKGWSSATPNIITNPSHFDSFHVAPQQSRRSVPSISTMPDLDFIAPRNRTSKK